MESKSDMIIAVALSICLVFAAVFSFLRGYKFGKERTETPEIKEVVKYVEVVATETAPEPTTQTEQNEQPESKYQVKSLGMFTLTAYDPCTECSEEYGNMTSTGVTAKEGRTIAVDPSVIPYGSKIIIDGFDEVYTAEDCGGYIKGNKIDIFFDSHKEVESFGKQQAEVFLLECTK